MIGMTRAYIWRRRQFKQDGQKADHARLSPPRTVVLQQLQCNSATQTTIPPAVIIDRPHHMPLRNPRPSPYPSRSSPSPHSHPITQLHPLTNQLPINPGNTTLTPLTKHLTHLAQPTHHLPCLTHHTPCHSSPRSWHAQQLWPPSIPRPSIIPPASRIPRIPPPRGRPANPSAISKSPELPNAPAVRGEKPAARQLLAWTWK